MAVSTANALPFATQARWVHGPLRDVAVAFAWLPFSILALGLLGNTRWLNSLLGGVFLLSFLHQPLTLALVYGDRKQFRLRPVLFGASPFIMASAIWIGMHASLIAVAVVAGLWNAEHTLMQRYGITRIYGRKGGDDLGELERPMLLSWLVLAVVWAAADPRTEQALSRLIFDSINGGALNLMVSLRGIAQTLVVPVALGVVWLSVRWLRAERSLITEVNPAKRLYVGATASLFVVMLIHPVVGFIGYVAAHAVEYFVIVHQALVRRYGQTNDASALGRAVRLPTGSVGFLVAYVLGVFVLTGVLESVGNARVYLVVVLTLGGLHIFYDGFIWKLRRPEVANSLAATPG